MRALLIGATLGDSQINVAIRGMQAFGIPYDLRTISGLSSIDSVLESATQTFIIISSHVR